jgi:hypothetical protein
MRSGVMLGGESEESDGPVKKDNPCARSHSFTTDDEETGNDWVNWYACTIEGL